jgi:hypothetical protein
MTARVGSDRVIGAAMKVLAGTLAAVYLFSAVTMPGGHTVVAAGEAVIAVAELAWIAAVSLVGERRWPYLAGAVLQLALTVLWVASRTTGLPGVGRLPIGVFDLLCAADALVVAVLAWRRAGPSIRRGRVALCQLAVSLAACTVFMSMASMMSMTAPAAAAGAGAWSHGHATAHYFCHLL